VYAAVRFIEFVESGFLVSLPVSILVMMMMTMCMRWECEGVYIRGLLYHRHVRRGIHEIGAFGI
jgi:hypothetical protein